MTRSTTTKRRKMGIEGKSKFSKAGTASRSKSRKILKLKKKTDMVRKDITGTQLQERGRGVQGSRSEGGHKKNCPPKKKKKNKKKKSRITSGRTGVDQELDY